jgi:DtxR family transcriptional regulator, Mn-dependent transcriptional regulator
MTESLEDYLEAILLLGETEKAVRVSDIATRLEVSKPSVHHALHELEDRGLVEHQPYQDVFLTDKGLSAAREVRRRHAVLKSFLVDVLEVPEAEAEREACAMEHDLSADTIDKIAAWITLDSARRG